MNTHCSYLMAVVPAFVGSVVAAETQPVDQDINVAQIRGKADAGDVASQRRMGILYLAGAGGVEKNCEEGIRWLRKAVAQGDAYSKTILGLCLVFDKRSWFVSLENGKVQCGIRYHMDPETNQEDFIETNSNRDQYREGMEMLRSHAETEVESRLFTMLGFLFDRDRDVREQGWNMIDHLRNDPAEEKRVVAILCSGMVGMTSQYPESKQRGLEMFLEMVGQIRDGDKIEEIVTSMASMFGGDGQTFRKVLEKMAAEGNSDAELLLAWSYGSDSMGRDDAKELELLQGCARKGNRKAMACLAYGYRYGTFVPKDDMKCFQWMTLAAEGGNPQGMSGLSECYREGIGVEKDENKALFWDMKAQDAMREKEKKDKG